MTPLSAPFLRWGRGATKKRTLVSKTIVLFSFSAINLCRKIFLEQRRKKQNDGEFTKLGKTKIHPAGTRCTIVAKA